jgi:hypothetical protein
MLTGYTLCPKSILAMEANVAKASTKWFPSLPRWVNSISLNSLEFRQVFLVRSQLIVLGLSFSFHNFPCHIYYVIFSQQNLPSCNLAWQ